MIKGFEERCGGWVENVVMEGIVMEGGWRVQGGVCSCKFHIYIYIPHTSLAYVMDVQLV